MKFCSLVFWGYDPTSKQRKDLNLKMFWWMESEMFLIRTKSDSGKRLTDQEILRQIKVCSDNLRLKP